MKQTRWGIIGPGTIARNFADGLREAPSGRLVAIASRSAARRQKFGDAYGLPAEGRHETYEALAADPGVDAVYIATPHPWHAEHSIMAMRAGKAVLCEKPAGMNAAEVVAVTEAAAQEGVFFMEAFMYRSHPQIARMLEIVGSGEIGTPIHIRASLGFAAAFDPASRLFDAALGGGAMLDVGCYPVSLARLLAGAAAGVGFAEPVELRGVGLIGRTGVDEVAYGVLKFAGGFTAEIACAITRPMDNGALVTGTKGTIHLADPWTPGRDAGPSDATITVVAAGTRRVETLRHPEHLFAFEAEVASRAAAEGAREAPAPALAHQDSIGNAAALDRWRREVGYETIGERPGTSRTLKGALPSGLPTIPKATLDGVPLALSRLVIGCDNREDLGAGAVVWDAFMEAGGNAFDTAFVYGAGRHEVVLGQWIAARGVAREVAVIVKGAHPPYCLPDAIAAQLAASLDRLGLEKAPIYIMHRDNPEVPVGEFVDALNRLHQAGRIGIFGGSNWSVERLAEANAYAAAKRLQPMRILNNNLSLAVMERPVWKGCVSSNTPETLAFLRGASLAHLAWSSQARGYFLPAGLRQRLPAQTGPDACFGSPANEERRRRAESLAGRHGVSAHNIATAWVLAQAFPSFAIIGPRSPGEIASTLPALRVALGADDVAWLNLERE